MLRINLFLTLLLSTASPASALFVDFEDLTPQVDSFAPPDIIVSNGVSFQARVGVEGVSSRPVFVEGPNSGFIAFNSTHLQLVRNSAVGILPPAQTEFLSFRYQGRPEGHPFDRLIINDVATMFSNGFLGLNGTGVGEVQIGVIGLIDPTDNLEKGLVTLTGNLLSLTIEGDSLAIDDVTIHVPEPTGALLMLLAMAGISWRRLSL